MQAKSQNGQWLVRMDDIDTPRNQAGADTAILNSLEKNSFTAVPVHENSYKEKPTLALAEIRNMILNSNTHFVLLPIRKQLI
jgi:glutamyl-Q tRNA(Asp) synthetase